MTLLLHAITGGAPARMDGLGGDDARLEALAEGDLTAVVSDEVDPGQGQGIEQLWRHERMIESLMERIPVLPVRYGSRLPDRAHVRALLRDRRDELTSALARVGGAVELSVDARTRSMDTSERPLSGREYMLGRLAQHRSTTEIMDRLQSLGAFARASQMRPLRPPAVGVNGAYLMEPEAVEEFARRVAELAGSLSDVDVVCTGPWPPYTFAEEPDQ